MIKRITEIVPAQSLILLLMCGAGMLVFIFLFILPAQKTSAELDKKIEEKRSQIDRQKILKPVFERMLVKATAKSPTRLPMVAKAKLTRGDMKKISTQIQSLIQRNNLRLKEITPDVNSSKERSGYLLIRLAVTGDFFNFRKFLLDLGSIPAMVHMQEITIRSIEESREMKVKIWLAQE
jgi:Tfp pilus assembly protein PilO